MCFRFLAGRNSCNTRLGLLIWDVSRVKWSDLQRAYELLLFGLDAQFGATVHQRVFNEGCKCGRI